MAINFPSSPGIGSVFTDSTSGFSYEWDGTVWKSYAAASSSSIRIIDDISGSFNGIGKTFALTSGSVALNPKNAASLLINLGGVVQDPFDDYTVSGSNIVFSTAPDAILTFSGIQYGDAIPVTDIVSDAYTRQTYTATSGQTSFNFNAGYTVGFLDVYRNGIKLLPGTDFTATTGTTFVLTDPAVLNDDVEAIGFRISSSTTTEGNITNLTVSGISSLTNLRVTGISTFGITNTLVIDDSGNVTLKSAVVGSEVTINSTGINVTGVATATSFSGNLTGNAQGLTGSPSITVTNISAQDVQVGGALTVTGNFTVNGTQTIINTDILNVEDANIGIASVTPASDATADGAGITIYGSTDKTWTWERDTGCFEYSEPNKFKGVVETVAVGATYDLGGGRVVLELDVRNATTYTHSLSNGNVGIVSFKNMPADTGVQNGSTITVLFTQNATGTGNTTDATGIGTNCYVVGYENGATVAGISTRALVGTATTVTLSDTASDVDFVSFFVHYNGGTNTDAGSYKIYVTKNGGFR